MSMEYAFSCNFPFRKNNTIIDNTCYAFVYKIWIETIQHKVNIIQNVTHQKHLKDKVWRHSYYNTSTYYRLCHYQFNKQISKFTHTSHSKHISEYVNITIYTIKEKLNPFGHTTIRRLLVLDSSSHSFLKTTKI